MSPGRGCTLMQRTNIYLDDEQLRALKHLAVEEHQSMADIVRKAVDEYLAKHLVEDTAWQERLNTLIERVRSRLPTDFTSAEIEADISTVREDVREAHRTARRR